MTPIPVSAFEMYNKNKKRKKQMKKKSKNKEIKLNPLLGDELQRVSQAQKKIPKQKGIGQSNAIKKVNAVAEDSDIHCISNKETNSLIQNHAEDPASAKDTVAVKTKKLKRKHKDHTANGVEPELSKSPSKKVSEETVNNKLKSPSDRERRSAIQHSTGGKSLKKNSPRKEHEPNKILLSQLPNSTQNAQNLLAWLINPISADNFFSQYWEKRPLHVSRKGFREYYAGLLSSPAIDSMFRKNVLFFGKNVDVTSYSDGERKTHNPSGRAQAAVVWDYYKNGCSVRLLNPQTYHQKLRSLNTSLQEVFGSFVGSNAYLTPPNSQGFAPHYDDIEAFVLQVEGSKMWKVYAPRDPSEVLPRTSSGNFSQSEIGKPVLEVKMEPGDLLYFPRGFIHQASTVPDHHSLHITVSTYQQNSWADFMEKLVPTALAVAIQEDKEFRQGMPLDVLQHVGVVHSDSQSPERAAILAKLNKLFSKLFKHALVDAAADQLGKDFQHAALPPVLSSDEKKCSVLETSEGINTSGQLTPGVILTSDTNIRLTRPNVLRLVSEEENEDQDIVRLYHSMDNSLEYHGEDPQFVDIPVNFAPAVEELIRSYPDFIPIHSLPLETKEEKMQIALELWEHGLVLTDAPIPTV